MFRFFTGNPQVAKAKLAALQARIDILEANVPLDTVARKRLETTLAELREEFAEFQTAFHRLRGQVHGPRAQDVIGRPKARQVQEAESKEELRRRAGIVAGKYPAAHSVTEPPQQDEGA